MTLSQFLLILRSRWVVIASLLLSAIVLVGVLSAVWPRTYTATAAVLVDVKSPDPIAGIIVPGLSAPGYMATQVDVIQSDRVSQQVVRSLKPVELEALRELWLRSTHGEGAFEDWASAVFRRSLDVKPSRESNVIAIAYRSSDPRAAAAMANAYAKAYVEVSLELRVDPAKQYGKFFEDRSQTLRQRVEEARSRLTAYQQKTGIVGSDERLDIETARLQELSSQLVALQLAATESSSAEAQAGKSPDRLPQVIANGVIGALKTELARDEARLQELRQRLGESNPWIAELRASVAEKQARITSETARIVGATSLANSINTSRVDQLRRSLDDQRLKVLQAKQERDELAALASDVDSAQRAYDGVNARANQTELESRTTQTNLYILNPASQPTQPASPRVVLNILLAAFFGTLAATCVALALEFFDRRVLSAADVVGALDLPLLGTLARKSGGRLFGRGNAPAEADTGALASAPTATLAGPRPPKVVAPASSETVGGSDPILAPLASAEPVELVKDSSLGEILRETHRLDAAQIDSILRYQREHGVLFGEAAIALKMVDRGDVLWALSRQYHYPYALDRKQFFNPELITATTPFSTVSETFRSIRSQLLRRIAHAGDRRALAVVSADEHDGKTFLATNLAVAFSQLGRKTLLIDADMRSPRLHKVFGIDNSKGLSSLLAGRHSPNAVAPVADFPSLFVLPVGAVPPNPLELLESAAFGKLLQEVLSTFDHVIIDSPAAVVGADAGVIAARGGAFVSVARRGRTRMDSMRELVRSLQDNSTYSYGFVLNEH